MAIDQLRVSLNLNEIHCSDEADGSGDAEPFLWVVYFKVDGDTVFLGDDLMLHGSATIVTTSGNHGNLLNIDVDAGDTVGIPPALGAFSTKLKPIRTPIKGKAFGGVAGVIAILMEEDSTSDADIEKGHAALNDAVRKQIDAAIQTIGREKPDLTDQDIDKIESEVSTAVTAAVSDEVDWFQGLWSYIGFGNGQDDKIGTAKYISKYDDLRNLVGTTVPLKWSWKNGEGEWSMKGSVTVHQTAAAAIMRGGDWGSRLLFGRTTKQFIAETQDLFDHKGLRLLQMDTWLEDGVRRWSSIHRSGDWAHRLKLDRDTKTFLKETQDLFDHEGLRLEHMVSYLDGGVRRWAGSYRSGDWAHRLTIDRDTATFAKETQDFFDKEGFRLEQVITYVDGNARRWAGIYRSGNWGHRFTMSRDTKTFLAETQRFFDDDGLRLIDVERYTLNGQPAWAGVYRTGTWSHRLVIDRGVESLLEVTQKEFDDKGRRVICVDVYDR